MSDTVYEDVYRRITNKELQQGQRLPTELELAESFGVSRTVVREALLRLKVDGLIASRQGAGHYVLATPSRSVLDFTAPGSIADIQRCYEFRVGVEGEAAALAAERITPERHEEIEAVLAETEKARDAGASGSDEDIAFHLAIARATENSYYETVIASCASAMRVGISIALTLSARPDHSIRRLDVVLHEHRAIYEAIRSGNADLSRQRMREHINGARRRVFVGQ